MLAEVVGDTEPRPSAIDTAVAGKTGTTQKIVDADTRVDITLLHSVVFSQTPLCDHRRR